MCFEMDLWAHTYGTNGIQISSLNLEEKARSETRQYYSIVTPSDVGHITRIQVTAIKWLCAKHSSMLDHKQGVPILPD